MHVCDVVVVGQWSSWSSWSVCSRHCRRHRRRVCDTQTSSWSSWSVCSRHCRRHRRRVCDTQTSSWSSWSVCSRHCRRHRRRVCDTQSSSFQINDFHLPHTQCLGSDVDSTRCTGRPFCQPHSFCTHFYLLNMFRHMREVNPFAIAHDCAVRFTHTIPVHTQNLLQNTVFDAGSVLGA